MAIERLSLLTDATGAIYFAINLNNQDYRLAMPELVIYLNGALDIAAPQTFTTQYASPSATGFSVQILNANENVHLILTPTAGFAAGTIVLPSSLLAVDKQEVLLNTTQSVTTLTINGNGSTVTGAPTTLAANAFFRLKYDQNSNVWYRVG